MKFDNIILNSFTVLYNENCDLSLEDKEHHIEVILHSPRFCSSLIRERKGKKIDERIMAKAIEYSPYALDLIKDPPDNIVALHNLMWNI